MSEWDDHLRAVIGHVSAEPPQITAVARVPAARDDQVLAHARASRPAIIEGLLVGTEAERLTLDLLVENFGDQLLRVRTGDYIGAAFSQRRGESLMSLAEYVAALQDLAADGELPPYAGNNPVTGALASLIAAPRYFRALDYETPGMWLGPAGAITPLHHDLVDNFLMQVIGRKSLILYPPHEEHLLYTWEATGKLHGSAFDALAPDYERFPLAAAAHSVTCTIRPGDTLFLPAGWFHHVRSLELSLSVNFFVNKVPEAVLARMQGLTTS